MQPFHGNRVVSREMTMMYNFALPNINQTAPLTMKKTSSRESQPQVDNKMRYHILGPDHLYAPIPFLFVTDRMCKEIVAEREMILDKMPPAEQARQRKIFTKYNPTHSAAAFNSVLRLFAMNSKD